MPVSQPPIPAWQPACVSAARISIGSHEGYVDKQEDLVVVRDPTQHCTATIVMFYCVAGGVPSDTDVVAAIEDIERLYASCGASGRLAEAPFDFMKAILRPASTFPALFGPLNIPWRGSIV